MSALLTVLARGASPGRGGPRGDAIGHRERGLRSSVHGTLETSSVERVTLWTSDRHKQGGDSLKPTQISPSCFCLSRQNDKKDKPLRHNCISAF